MVEAPQATASRPVALLSRLERDVLKVVLYFDLFRHPLSPQEIYEFLPSNSTTPAEVASVCSSPTLTAIIDSFQGLFFLKERGSECVSERRNKENIAARRWKIARFVVSLIGYFPFVRGVGISGELSKGVSTAESDIDYVVITKGGRLWICRTLLIIFKKTVLFNSKKYFCINHVVSEDHLQVVPHNVYTALELATVQPMLNDVLFIRYHAENPWLEQFLPNWWSSFRKDREPNISGRTFKPSILQRILELPLYGIPGDRVEQWLMRFWVNVWKRRYPDLSDEERSRRFAATPHLSTAYGGDTTTVILSRYRERLERFALLDHHISS